MQGRQINQPKLFSVVNLENFIPQNHILRKIDGVLDLSFVHELTRGFYCENNGRPSIDPELFLRMILLGYLNGISSDRQLCEEIGYNLSYKWFCKLNLEDSVPDHSSLTKTRDRLGEETFKNIFEKVINICIKKGLIKGKVMMDGSLVKADAALRSMVDRPVDGEKLEDKETTKYIKNRKIGNKFQISKTDPESTLAGKAGESKRLSYKVHNTIDRDSRIIIDSHATTGADPEGTVMIDRIDHIEKTLNIKVEEVTADRGYGYGKNLNTLNNRQIKSFVPRFHSDAGERVKRDSEGFTFDKSRDCFICPQGHSMFSIQGSTPDYKRYRIKGRHCSGCPLKETCLTTPSMKKRGSKHIEMHIYQDAIDRAAQMETTQEFKILRGERQWKIEGIFAEAKNNHGLLRARYRGRANMQIQAYMIATTQNLKRLALLSLGPIKSIFEKLSVFLDEKLYFRWIHQ